LSRRRRCWRRKEWGSVTHRDGDALVDDLGTDAFDVILLVSLVHHFDDATNRSLVARAAAALRPGGVLVIGDLLRPDSPQKSSAMDTFFDLYFALTSRSGLWSFAEMADWQRAAGLSPRRPMRLLPGQSFALQVGQRVA
jgi:SAM-dependent methyltransferase